MKKLLLSATLTLALGVAGAAGEAGPGPRGASGGVRAPTGTRLISPGDKSASAGTAGKDKGKDAKTGTTPKTVAPGTTTAAKKGTGTTPKSVAGTKGTGKSGKVAPLWVKFKGKNYRTLAGGYKRFSYRYWYRPYKCWCYYDPYGLGWCFWCARYNCFLPVACIGSSPPAASDVPVLGATPPVLPPTPPPPPPPAGGQTTPPGEGETHPPDAPPPKDTPPPDEEKPPAGGAASKGTPPKDG
jgi:hypothetical protein